MGVLKLDVFGGMAPAVDDRLLPDRAAAHSENCWVYSGRLQGFPQPTLVQALMSGTTSVYRIPATPTEPDKFGGSVWLEFEDPDTDVVRALVVDDTFDRYYWASSNAAPRYSTLERIENGDPPWLLGIPQPGDISVSPSGGSSGETVVRSYVVTWVSAYGEEGPPSNPETVQGKPDDTWQVTLPPPEAGDLGGAGADRNLTKVRIYRTVTSSAGIATYFFVDEVDIEEPTYDDVVTDTVVSGNSQLESTLWTAPPADLEGWVSMPNGFLAGWRSNEVWFSEPYRPHAWPAAYTIVVDYPIVGLGVAGQTLVICTRGFPVLASGVHPASIAQSKSLSFEPCTSRGSILSTVEGVFYSSPNGLIQVGGGTVRNVTQALATRDRWEGYVNTATLRAARLNNAYFAFGGRRTGSFDADAFDVDAFAQDDYQGSYSGLLIDTNNERVAFNLVSSTVPVSNVQNDPWTGEVYIIQDNNLYRVNLAEADPTRRVYLWRSKIYQVPSRGNLGVIQVFFDVPTHAPDDPGSAPGEGGMLSEFPELPDGSELGVVRFYADGKLRWERNLSESGRVMRLPSGYKADYFQIELETYVNVNSVRVASTAKELARA